MITIRALLLSVFLLPSAALAHQSTPPASDLSGTWFGTFTVTTPDKKVMHNTAVLILQQPGLHPAGSIGATVDQQSPWSNADFQNHQLRFHLAAAGGLDFVLDLQSAHLTGTATGSRMNATLDLKPAPGLLPHDQLFAEITAADQQLYNAFSNCDVARYATYLSPNLEFYQDHTGLTNYQQNLDALRDRCTEGIQLRRELDKTSLIINAAPGSGAIQSGIQRFYSKQPDGTEHLDATARFTNIWTKDSGTWKLLRVISFDHH